MDMWNVTRQNNSLTSDYIISCYITKHSFCTINFPFFTQVTTSMHAPWNLNNTANNKLSDYLPLPNAIVWSPSDNFLVNRDGSHCINCSDANPNKAQLVSIDINTITLITSNQIPILFTLQNYRWVIHSSDVLARVVIQTNSVDPRKKFL